MKVYLVLATLVASLAMCVPGAAAAEWTLNTSYPNYAWGTGAAALDGDHTLVAGGLGFPNGTYALLRRTFSISYLSGSSDAAVPELPAPRAGAAVATGDDGRVYVLGGLGQGTGGRLVPVAGALSFGAGETQWTPRAPMPVARGQAGVAVVPGGDIYVIGGYIRNAAGGSSLSNGVAIYHPSSNTWSSGPTLPAARGGISAATSGSTIYAMGGWAFGQKVDVWSLDTSLPSPVWQIEPQLPSPHEVAGAVADGNGRIFVIGGWDGRQDIRRVDTYRPSDGAWSCSMKLDRARSWNSASFLPANANHAAKIFTFAGASGRYLLKSSESSYPDASEADAFGPGGTVPVPHVATGQAPPVGIPMLLTWTSFDATTDVLNEHLQRSTDGTTWADVPVAWQTLRPAYFLQPNASMLQFRTTPEDCAGNSGNTHTGISFSTRSWQETSAAYQGGWLTASSPLHQGGHTRYASAAGARASFRFYGREIAWLSPKGPSHGGAYVGLDGRRVAAVSTYAKSGVARMVVYRHVFPTLGWHTITVTVRGTAGRPRIDVDAFLVIGKPVPASPGTASAARPGPQPAGYARSTSSRPLPLQP